MMAAILFILSLASAFMAFTAAGVLFARELLLIAVVLFVGSFIVNAIDGLRRRTAADLKTVTAALRAMGEHRATAERLASLGKADQ